MTDVGIHNDGDIVFANDAQNSVVLVEPHIFFRPRCIWATNNEAFCVLKPTRVVKCPQGATNGKNTQIARLKKPNHTFRLVFGIERLNLVIFCADKRGENVETAARNPAPILRQLHCRR